VERVPVAAPLAGGQTTREYDRPKPLPERSTLYERELPPEPPFDDVPLVSQKTPEQKSFEAAYRGVGRPRIAVFVNRTLDGEILPVANAEPNRERRFADDRYDRDRDRGRTYLKRGEYDEAHARAVDYEAVENILTDVLACQGAVEIVSPTMARQRLTDDQVKDLQAGKAGALRDVAGRLDTDVLVQVTVHPTRQTQYGLDVRLVGEALNVKGGQQIGRAVVDIPPPLEKTTVNRYARFVARKLMMDMTQSWSTGEPSRGTDRGAVDRPGDRGPVDGADRPVAPAPVPAPAPTPAPAPAPAPGPAPAPESK
jgi:hypothetical protein